VVAQNGEGGAGGGAVLFACDGVLTLNGRVLVDGAPGGVGLVNGALFGGGGGGGAGGAVVLQALQGVRLGRAAQIVATGGAGGAGADPGVNDGGAGGDGAVRVAVPVQSRFPATTLVVAPAAVIAPAADLTGF
ncbi:MAG TPA: hypothetical protein VEI02_02155, partial [Planctomycetota bacterium]|nr:hypothetical protein [Planctomycetota bacterium]